MKIIKRCKSCLMADSKPGVILNENGVCPACVNRLKRKNIDWPYRTKEFLDLVYQHKRGGSDWDCVIPSSGGKDSWFQVWQLKKQGLKPVCIRVTDPYTHTKVGTKNWANMLETFKVDGFTFELNPDTARRLTVKSFEMFGSPTWPIDRAIYALPLRFAARMGIPLVVYGENVSYEYGGVQKDETASAITQITNDVAKSVPFDEMICEGVTAGNMFSLSLKPINLNAINPVYLSYYFPWSGFRNYLNVKKLGFKTLDDINPEGWKRNGYIEQYDQIDSIGYLINVWMKYIKLGFGRATDVVGYWIRDGLITRETGRHLILEHDHKLDRKVLVDFLRFTGLTRSDFLSIVNDHYIKYDDELGTMNLSWENNEYEAYFDDQSQRMLAEDWEVFDDILQGCF